VALASESRCRVGERETPEAAVEAARDVDLIAAAAVAEDTGLTLFPHALCISLDI
jgi:hypothetical protein